MRDVDFYKKVEQYREEIEKFIEYLDRLYEIKQKYPHTKGVKLEGSLYRELIFSTWHRSLRSDCYMYDLDVIEVRPKKGIVALCEVKSEHASLNIDKHFFKVAVELYNKIGVPFIFIRYNNDLSKFKVRRINQQRWEEMPHEEMKKYIENL